MAEAKKLHRALERIALSRAYQLKLARHDREDLIDQAIALWYERIGIPWYGEKLGEPGWLDEAVLRQQIHPILDELSKRFRGRGGRGFVTETGEEKHVIDVPTFGEAGGLMRYMGTRELGLAPEPSVYESTEFHPDIGAMEALKTERPDLHRLLALHMGLMISPGVAQDRQVGPRRPRSGYTVKTLSKITGMPESEVSRKITEAGYFIRLFLAKQLELEKQEEPAPARRRPW